VLPAIHEHLYFYHNMVESETKEKARVVAVPQCSFSYHCFARKLLNEQYYISATFCGVGMKVMLKWEMKSMLISCLCVRRVAAIIVLMTLLMFNNLSGV
jgi:hypothetical protein